MADEKNKFGLSRKTNVAIAAMSTISVAQTATPAIVAIAVVALVALTYQFMIDKGKNHAADN